MSSIKSNPSSFDTPRIPDNQRFVHSAGEKEVQLNSPPSLSTNRVPLLPSQSSSSSSSSSTAVIPAPPLSPPQDMSEGGKKLKGLRLDNPLPVLSHENSLQIQYQLFKKTLLHCILFNLCTSLPQALLSLMHIIFSSTLLFSYFDQIVLSPDYHNGELVWASMGSIMALVSSLISFTVDISTSFIPVLLYQSELACKLLDTIPFVFSKISLLFATLLLYTSRYDSTMNTSCVFALLLLCAITGLNWKRIPIGSSFGHVNSVISYILTPRLLGRLTSSHFLVSLDRMKNSNLIFSVTVMNKLDVLLDFFSAVMYHMCGVETKDEFCGCERFLQYFLNVKKASNQRQNIKFSKGKRARMISSIEDVSEDDNDEDNDVDDNDDDDDDNEIMELNHDDKESYHSDNDMTEFDEEFHEMSDEEEEEYQNTCKPSLSKYMLSSRGTSQNETEIKEWQILQIKSKKFLIYTLLMTALSILHLLMITICFSLRLHSLSNQSMIYHYGSPNPPTSDGGSGGNDDGFEIIYEN